MSGTAEILNAHLDQPECELLEECTRLGSSLAATAAAGAEGRLNRPLVAELASSGLFERLFVDDGEQGWQTDVSALDLCLIREGLARGSTEAETAFALQGLGSFPLLQAGRPELVAEWIPRLASGEAVAAFALSEPDAGSDVASLALIAEPDEGGYRLTGEKTWISNAPDADVYSVFARTTVDAGARGLSAFLVAGDTPGLSGESLDLLSPHAIGRLTFDRVFVPSACLLGEVDGGFAVAMRTLDMFRPSVGAFSIGMALSAIDAAVSYTSERQAFGRPLKSFQAVSHALADVATKVNAARLLVHHAARCYDRGLRPVTQVSAMAKLLATEVAQEAVDVAVQVHGARGLERGHLLEHLYRDVRAPRIYEGASEIQREIIARAMVPAESGSRA